MGHIKIIDDAAAGFRVWRDQRAARRLWRASGCAARPFVILANARCGNNMLRSALHGHPDILIENEVLLFAHDTRHHHLVPDGLAGEVRARPEVGLIKLLLRGAQKRATGYTHLYFHMRKPDQLRLWRFLAGFDGLRVIDLRRRNLFFQWLSYCEAMATDQWVVWDHGTIPQREAIAVSARDFNQWLDRVAEEQAFALHHLGRHPSVRVYYEDLVDGFDREAARILDFLELPPWPLRATSLKTGVRPIAARVADFDSFLRAVAGTPGEPHVRDALALEADGLPR